MVCEHWPSMTANACFITSSHKVIWSLYFFRLNCRAEGPPLVHCLLEVCQIVSQGQIVWIHDGQELAATLASVQDILGNLMGCHGKQFYPNLTAVDVIHMDLHIFDLLFDCPHWVLSCGSCCCNCEFGIIFPSPHQRSWLVVFVGAVFHQSFPRSISHFNVETI